MAGTWTPRRSLIFPKGVRKPVQPVIDWSHPLARGLVGCYMLGESGAGVKDISRTGNVGTFNGGTSTLSSSHHGGLSNSTVAASTQNFSFSKNVQVGAFFTVSIWVNTNSVANQTPIAQIDSGQANATFYLRIDGNSGFTTSGTSYHEVSSPAPATGGWHLVALMYDGVNLTSWLDGAQFQAAPFATLTPDVPASPGLSIGSLGASAGGYFDGLLDGARIYARPLSAAEHQQLYAEPYAAIYCATIPYRVGVATGGVTGDAAWTEGNDVLAASGSVNIAGSAAWTEANDTLAATGSLGVFGAAAWTESNDTLAAQATLGVFGAAVWTEGQDAWAISGTVSLTPITGDLAWTEGPDRWSGDAVNGNADTHDPGITDAQRKRLKKREEKRRQEFEAEAATREQRKAQVIGAFERIIDGKPQLPDAVADEIIAAIEAKAEPEAVQFDIAELVHNASRVQQLWDEFIERDDEEVLALL